MKVVLLIVVVFWNIALPIASHFDVLNAKSVEEWPISFLAKAFSWGGLCGLVLPDEFAVLGVFALHIFCIALEFSFELLTLSIMAWLAFNDHVSAGQKFWHIVAALLYLWKNYFNQLVLECIAQEWFCLLPYCSRAFVIAVVQQDGRKLRYASEVLRHDRDVVGAAIQQDGAALEFAAEELKNDFSMALSAVKSKGSALQYVSEGLKNNRYFMLVAVKHFGLGLSYASKKVANDREVVIAALWENMDALRYASPQLQADDEVVRLAHRVSR